MPSDGDGSSDDHRGGGNMKEHTSTTSSLQQPTQVHMDSTDKELSNEPGLAPDTAPSDADGDRIGGFVWKFPSEGSNSKPGDDAYSVIESYTATPYPRKCRYCQNAWVSSFVNERKHWKQCNPEACTSDTSTEPPSLGIARRVWCEVDSTLTALQWREDADASQDSVLNRIAFREIAVVDVLETPREAFRVTTMSGRRVVFQCRLASAEAAQQGGEQDPELFLQNPERANLPVVRALDAKQWSEYLQIFSRFTQDQDTTTGYEANDLHSVDPAQEQIYECADTHSEILGEITRAIIAKDVDSLEELLMDEEDRGSTLALLDDNGSSLLVVAFKLGGDERIIRALVKAGVDCNRQNKDGETPLLLAAASGELELLRVLLSIDGLDVNQRCAMGATAFHAAANAGEVDVLRLLCNYGGVSTHDIDDNGWTALHYAAVCPTGLQAMCFLCELMPEMVDTQCLQGNTALHLAAGYGCVENTRVLLQTAANPHLPNAEGDTAYHVALHNHHISCAMAIHEYMDTPRDAYERVAAVDFTGTKAHEVTRAELTLNYGLGQQLMAPVDDNCSYYGYGDDGEAAWVECMTEDQIPYYYNTATGVSTWYKPDLPTASATTLPPAPVQSLHFPFETRKPPADGQKLPLCMIPLVSPLVSLDDPTAATKFDSRRRKDRERRRSKKLRHQQSHADAPRQKDMPPPPPPMVPPTQQHHERQHQSLNDDVEWT